MTSERYIETGRGVIHAWQCDHMGHANLRAYGEFFEQSLWQLLNHVGLTPTFLRTSDYRMAGVQQNIAYKRELYAGDCIVIRSRLMEYGEKKLTMFHEMRNIESGELCATAELTAVCISNSTRRAAAFPLEISKRLQSAVL